MIRNLEYGRLRTAREDFEPFASESPFADLIPQGSSAPYTATGYSTQQYGLPEPVQTTAAASSSVYTGPDPTVPYVVNGQLQAVHPYFQWLASREQAATGVTREWTQPDYDAAANDWAYNHAGIANPNPSPFNVYISPTPVTPAATTPAATTPAPTTTAPTPAPAVGSSTVPATPATPAQTAADMISATPGYQFQLTKGLDALNSNAYARGLGRSGATYKALEDYGQSLAQNYYQQYLSNTMAVANQGYGAAGAIAGAGNNMGAGVSGAMENAAQAYQNSANATANSAYQRANATSSMATGVANGLGTIAGSVFGSSYRGY